MSVYHISHGKDDIVPESYKLNVDDPSLNDQKASALQHEYNSSPKTLREAEKITSRFQKEGTAL